jgi:uncharacterized membrane-anchored protein
MKFSGIVKKDRRTKNLTARIQPGEIALIAHDDIDAVAAESLVACKVKAVLNCCKSLTGSYINRGPYTILRAGIPLVDNFGREIMEQLQEGDTIEVIDGAVFRNGERIASGAEQTRESLDEQLQLARENMESQIEQFAANTLGYLKKEVYLLTRELKLGNLDLNFKGRHVLIVVRGPEYKKDLHMLRTYIRDRKPVTIAVDGGADALMEFGVKPDIILGDMDSVSDKTLGCGALMIVHGYESGKAPGMERLEKLGLEGRIIASTGTSEDLALLLAYEREAELIVIVGSHFSMEDFLGKDRAGMSSTFLTRLKVGNVLVDAKGVSKLYEKTFRPTMLAYIILAALFPIVVFILVSPLGEMLKQFFRLYRMLISQ